MFGIDDIALMALLGGGLGAATSKKPLQGALMGAGLGAAGGAFLPGLLGGGAAAAGTGATTAEMAGVGAGVIPEGAAFAPATASEMAGMGASAGAPGLFGTVMGYAKPVAQAASAAGAVGSLFPRQQPMQAPQPMPMTGAGSQTMGMLAQQGEQAVQQQLMAAEQARRQRRMGLLGGGYGAA